MSRELGINVKTVAKGRKRDGVQDAAIGPKEAHSTVLGIEEEAVIAAFRCHTLPPLDDCHYALQPGIPRLPEVEGDKPKMKFGRYPVGYFHIDIAEVRPGSCAISSRLCPTGSTRS